MFLLHVNRTGIGTIIKARDRAHAAHAVAKAKGRSPNSRSHLDMEAKVGDVEETKVLANNQQASRLGKARMLDRMWKKAKEREIPWFHQSRHGLQLCIPTVYHCRLQRLRRRRQQRRQH